MDVLENILEKYFELYNVQNWNKKKMRKNKFSKFIWSIGDENKFLS